MKTTHFLKLVLILSLLSCSEEKTADLVIQNGSFYSAHDSSQIECLASKDGKIIYVGSKDGLNKFIGEGTEVIDAKGQFVMPGFIEGHGHFSGMGKTL